MTETTTSIARNLMTIAQQSEVVWDRPVSSMVLEGIIDRQPLGVLFRDALQEIGLGASIDDAAARMVETMLSASDAPFDPSISTRAAAIGQQFAQRGLAHLVGVEEPILKTLISQYQLGIVGIDQVAAAVNRTVGQAQSITNTAIAGIQRVAAREVSRTISDSPEIYFMYEGPVDMRTRGYCRALAGKAVQETLLANTPNGHGLPPLVYCGGWNCRHTLIPTNLRIIQQDGVQIATIADYNAARAGGSGR